MPGRDRILLRNYQNAKVNQWNETSASTAAQNRSKTASFFSRICRWDGSGGGGGGGGERVQKRSAGGWERLCLQLTRVLSISCSKRNKGSFILFSPSFFVEGRQMY